MTEVVIIYKPVYWFVPPAVDWFLYHNGLRHERVKGRVHLWQVQTPSFQLLEEWSERNKLWPDNSRRVTLGGVSELRYVSETQIIPKLWARL